MRRMIRDGMKPGTPEYRLLAKPVKVRSRTGVIEKEIAIVDAKTERGMYLKLKQAYIDHPEVRDKVHAMMGYRKLLKNQKVDIGGTVEEMLAKGGR